VTDWSETFLVSKTGVIQPDGKFTATVTQAELTTAFELDGEKTFLVETEVFRFNKSYKSRKYVNHLGIYDSFIRLRSKVNFLEVTKKDE
jgi:hypothetical protein